MLLYLLLLALLLRQPLDFQSHAIELLLLPLHVGLLEHPRVGETGCDGVVHVAAIAFGLGGLGPMGADP